MRPIIAFIAFIVTFVIGVTLSILYAFTAQSGRLENWHRLPSPPAEPREFVLGKFGDLYVRTADGQFYTCKDPLQEDCWILSGTPSPAESDPYLNECKDNSFHMINPPFVVIQQLEWKSCNIEGISQKIYALSDKGDIWQWNHGTLAQATIFTILLGWCISFVFGLLVASAFLLYRRRLIKIQSGP